jgi:hypothetical protein
MKIKDGLEAAREKMQWHILRYYLQGLPHCMLKVSRFLLATKVRPHSEASPCGICGRQILSRTYFSQCSYFVPVAIIRPTIHTRISLSDMNLAVDNDVKYHAPNLPADFPTRTDD